MAHRVSKATIIPMTSNRGGRIETRPDDQQGVQIQDLSDDFSGDSITTFNSRRHQDVSSRVSDDSQQPGSSVAGLDDSTAGPSADAGSTDDQANPSAPSGDRRRQRRQRGHGGGRSGGERGSRDVITGSGDNRGYRFDTNGDTVLNLRRVRRGVSRLETIEPGETWRFDGVHLIQTEQQSLGTSVTTYGDSDGDRLFSRIGETFTPLAGGIPGGV